MDADVKFIAAYSPSFFGYIIYHLGFAGHEAQPIQPDSAQIGLNWLCFLAGTSQTDLKIFIFLD